MCGIWSMTQYVKKRKYIGTEVYGILSRRLPEPITESYIITYRKPRLQKKKHTHTHTKVYLKS